LDGKADVAVYALERHASLQNDMSVQTQLRGLLHPVLGRARFRDARAGLGLQLDDLYAVDEDIELTVTAGAKRLDLVATVINLDNRRPVAGPLPLTMQPDQLTHTLQLPTLLPDAYRVEINPIGAAAGTAQPVNGVFLVADDAEPAGVD
jgi:hypothetical protein